jgi:hypothetical protein
MASPTKTPPPPLYTADNVEMTIGMLVYGVDTHCRHSEMPIIEPLLVTGFDLGVARSVRLRRERGTEWRWSANADSDTCNTADQFIYAHYESARAAIETVTASLRETHVQAVQDSLNDLDYLKEDYKESVERTQKEIDEKKKTLADFDKQVAKLASSKPPTNPFATPSLPEVAKPKTSRSRPKKKIARKRR